MTVESATPRTKAVMPFALTRSRIDKQSREQVMAALLSAAAHFKFIEFGKREFGEGQFGCSAGTAQREFGSWSAGIDALREELNKRGQQLTKRSSLIISNRELFDEMQRIWNSIGQRPSRYQWEQNVPRYSYGTYKQRFGGWELACLAFIENRMGAPIETEPLSHSITIPIQPLISEKPIAVRKTIPYGLRYRILDRDSYRCVKCGRSPATEIGVQLHLDHIIPVSHGGLDIFENLRTLCAQCNIGRGNLTEHAK
jgi:HNH endonuclease/Homing endonuclease associated repeat